MRSWCDRARVAFLVAAFAGCTVEADDEPLDPDRPELRVEDATELAERPCPEDSALTYEDFGAPFMLSWCNGCHSAGMPEGMRQEAPLGSDFDSLEDIRAHADRIWARSGDHNVTMPPVGGPDDELRTMLGEWLACGAPTARDLAAGAD